MSKKKNENSQALCTIKIVDSSIHFIQTRSHGWDIFNKKSRKKFNILIAMR